LQLIRVAQPCCKLETADGSVGSVKLLAPHPSDHRERLWIGQMEFHRRPDRHSDSGVKSMVDAGYGRRSARLQAPIRFKQQLRRSPCRCQPSPSEYPELGFPLIRLRRFMKIPSRLWLGRGPDTQTTGPDNASRVFIAPEQPRRGRVSSKNYAAGRRCPIQGSIR